MYIATELTNYSLPQIAREFGKKDHTTVMYARDKIKEQMQRDEAYRNKIRQLIAMCQNSLNTLAHKVRPVRGAWIGRRPGAGVERCIAPSRASTVLSQAKRARRVQANRDLFRRMHRLTTAAALVLIY